MLSKEEVIFILEFYKQVSDRINVKFDYVIAEDQYFIQVKVESIDNAKFTVNGNPIKLGKTQRINFNEFRSKDGVIGFMNHLIFDMVEMILWQREGNIVTKQNQDESIKANKED